MRAASGARPMASSKIEGLESGFRARAMLGKIVGLWAESYSLTALTRIFTDGGRISTDQSLERISKPRQIPPADHRAAQVQEADVVRSSPIEANHQTSLPVQPRECALAHPAMAT